MRGNLFIMDDTLTVNILPIPASRFGAVLTSVKVRWSSDTSVTVGYDGRARIFKRKRRSARVRVKYEPR